MFNLFKIGEHEVELTFLNAKPVIVTLFEGLLCATFRNMKTKKELQDDRKLRFI